MGLAKILLFIFNFIFVILGIVVIASGILIYTSDDVDFDVLLTDSSLPFFSVGALTIIAGVVIFIVAFTGCCGAIKEHKCLLTVFIILLLIILVVELLVIILGYSYQGKADEIISDAIKSGMKQYNEDDKAAYMEAWDFVQQNKSCCGVDEASDWQMYGDFKNMTVPSSCCNGTETCTNDNAFRTGCKESLLVTASSKRHLLFAGTSSIITILVEILEIIFSCCVLRDAGKKGKGQQA